MGLGPAVASPIALRRGGVTMRDVGLVEINEAFAAQVLANLRVFEKPALGEHVGANLPEMGPIRSDALNVNGGAIALGHPVGTSGTRITLTLAKEMKRRGVQLGLASLCVGGGQGAAILLERS
jgi:acetyl-CoA acyltransferase